MGVLLVLMGVVVLPVGVFGVPGKFGEFGASNPPPFGVLTETESPLVSTALLLPLPLRSFIRLILRCRALLVMALLYRALLLVPPGEDMLAVLAVLALAMPSLAMEVVSLSLSSS